MKHCIIAAVLVCSGCLKSPPAEPVEPAAREMTVQDVLSDPIWDAGTFTPDEPQPPPAAVPQFDGHADNYTGAIVYSNTSVCVPCKMLDADLMWLARNYGWTCARTTDPEFTGREQWILAQPGEHGAIPFIEFWDNGKLIDTHKGYTTSRDPPVRTDALAIIVQKHPARR